MGAPVAGGDDGPAFRGVAAVPGGDDSARAFDDRDQGDYVVGVQRRLDHQVDMAGGQHAIGVAIAAIARQPRPGFDGLVTRPQVLGNEFGRSGHQSGVIEAGAGTGAQPPLGRGAVGAGAGPIGGAAVAEKPLARERLVHQAVNGNALVQKADKRAP